jgi:hypothetical protein
MLDALESVDAAPWVVILTRAQLSIVQPFFSV